MIKKLHKNTLLLLVMTITASYKKVFMLFV